MGNVLSKMSNDETYDFCMPEEDKEDKTTSQKENGESEEQYNTKNGNNENNATFFSSAGTCMNDTQPASLQLLNTSTKIFTK